MGSGGKSGSKVKASPAPIGVAGGHGGHADGPGGVAGGPAAGEDAPAVSATAADVAAPVAMTAPAAAGPVAGLYSGVSKVTATAAAVKGTAGGVLHYLKAAQPLAKAFDAAFSGAPDYAGLPEGDKIKLWAAAKDSAQGVLGQTPTKELQKAAAGAGFQHPAMVSGSLAFVLNPFYSSPNSLKAKAKIQAKALANYQALPPEKQAEVDQTEANMAAEALAEEVAPAEDSATPDAAGVAPVPPPAPEVDSPALPETAPVAGAAPEAPAPAPVQPTAPEPPKVTLPKLLANIATPFVEQLKLLAGLAMTARAARDLPVWRGKAAVEKLVFHPEGDASHLGGVHEKRLYRTPDGQRWLFKPDKKAGAVAAASEEASAELARRAGLPAVEVRVVKLGGKVGSIQPLAGDPGQLKSLPPSPDAWTLEQKSAVMAQHVLDWLIGDHDGNHQNFLVVGRTPVRIDRGQAFKFMGSDRLALDYEPNAVHGSPPHAAIALYRQVKEGKAKVNPMLLAPLIQKIEAIPDSEYRQILRPVAESGAKGKEAGWYRAAVLKAAPKKGKTSPADDAVAEAFLDMAVQRKHALRAMFEKFLSDVMGQPFQFVTPTPPPAAQAAGGKVSPSPATA